MRQFQLFRYLKKWMPVIILFFVVMTAFTYFFLSARQTYVATAVIQYNNADAVNGRAPDGSEIDTSEINSASNMTKAMESLGLSLSEYSLDQFCSSITVEPLLKEEDAVVQEALNEQGEKPVEEPTVYAVTCSMGSSVPDADTELVRNVLNELLDVYFTDYSEEHINRSQISSDVKGIQTDQYDYLDVANQISDLLEDTIETMNDYNNRAMTFRSVTTGYSFGDLRDDFSLLKKVNLYRLYSLILGNQLTKDRNLLISKYMDQSARYQLTSEQSQEEMEEINKIIETYVDKMRSSGNTYDSRESGNERSVSQEGSTVVLYGDDEEDYNYILNEVYDNYWQNKSDDPGWVKIDHTVEYDTLMTDWAKANNTADEASVDQEYCQFVLKTFNYTAPLGYSTLAGTGTDSEYDFMNDLQDPDISYEVISSTATARDVEIEIDKLMSRMNELFAIADATNAEYNEYLGAENIKTLSSVTAGSSLNIRMYMMIVAVVFLILGCGIAVILGRLGDIVEYLFLRDHLTGCMNRMACDNYITRMANESVSSNFCCLNLQLTNQREINRDLGREAADKILQSFARVLRETVENREESFVGYNGSGQFWAFFELDPSEENLAPEMERLVMVLNEQINEYPVAYSLGGAHSRALGTYHIRALITEAVTKRQDYVTTAAVTPAAVMPAEGAVEVS